MNNVERIQTTVILSRSEESPLNDTQSQVGVVYCLPNAEGHCITCSDEALPATVLRVDEESGLALVTVQETTEEIDITLVDTLAPGDVVLVHGGVAIALVSEASDE